MIAGPASPFEPAPATVRGLIARRPFALVWRNELDASTFEVADPRERVFIKWAPAGTATDLTREVTRLDWAAPYVVVPRVLDHGSNDEGAWMVTAAIPGENAVSARWKSDPGRAVTAIGQGLRALHDNLPAARCPFTWSAAARTIEARQHVEQGGVTPADWRRRHPTADLGDALRLLDHPPATDQLVVCHGDACAPNTLIGEGGRYTGHVDLGTLGLADRWADLAVATWSTEWNYGPGWDSQLLDAYGIDPDPERTHYYRLLWELSP